MNEGGAGCQTRFEYIKQGEENAGAGVINKEQVPVQRETGWLLPNQDDPLAELQEKTIAFDGLSRYCLDCNHEGEPRITVNVLNYTLQRRAILEKQKEREVRIDN